MAVVMLALDGSVFAEQALPHARGRLGPGDELLLVRVVEPVPVSRSSHLVDMTTRLLVREAEDYLDRLARLLRERGLQVRTRILSGRPREELPQEAAREEAAWLVLSSHGSGGLRGMALGSVAEGVVRRAPCPVWVVRCREPGLDLSEPWRVPPPPVRKLLIPLDASAQAEAALVQAGQLDPAEVILLAATDTLAPGNGSNVPRLQAYLEAVAEPLRQEGKAVRCLVCDEFADEAVARAAQEHSPDAILMTTHGRRGVDRWLLGSTAERVLRRVACPVVLLRTRTEAEQEAQREAVANR